MQQLQVALSCFLLSCSPWTTFNISYLTLCAGYLLTMSTACSTSDLRFTATASCLHPAPMQQPPPPYFYCSSSSSSHFEFHSHRKTSFIYHHTATTISSLPPLHQQQQLNASPVLAPPTSSAATPPPYFNSTTAIALSARTNYGSIYFQCSKCRYLSIAYCFKALLWTTFNFLDLRMFAGSPLTSSATHFFASLIPDLPTNRHLTYFHHGNSCHFTARAIRAP